MNDRRYIVRRPLCARCGVAESRLICGHHKLPLCTACQPVHHIDGCCYYNAVPAVHVMRRATGQLGLSFEGSITVR